MLMELVGKLLFLNEYGELGTINPVDRVEASERAAVVSSGVGVVSIVYLLAIFFVFAGENGLVCFICPGGGIWAAGTMVEAPAPAVGEVAAE